MCVCVCVGEGDIKTLCENTMYMCKGGSGHEYNVATKHSTIGLLILFKK